MNEGNFRIALVARGWRIPETQAADWIAYRATALGAVECETNNSKRKQVVIQFSRGFDGYPDRATVDVTGEAGGVWYRLEAYGLGLQECLDQIDTLEATLIAAWNGIPRAGDTAKVVGNAVSEVR